MKTIKIIALAAALTASMPAFAQETQRLTANKHNEYGLIYSLPKTHVNIEVEAVRTVKKAGPYYRYAREVSRCEESDYRGQPDVGCQGRADVGIRCARQGQ